jgi:hypothetical protein
MSYAQKPSEAQLKTDLNDWTKQYNHLDYRAYIYPVTHLPKNRRECLARYNRVCKIVAEAKSRQKLLADLLSHPPFNGQRVK